MSSQIIISGAKPYDGQYPLGLETELTAREWGWIKRLAGYLPMAVDDNAFGDPELVCALAAIALRRAGRIQAADVPAAYDTLVDAPFGSAITIKADEAPETEAVPDPSPANANGSARTSGNGSPASSASPATRPSPTGTPGSDISASVPPMSAT